ncbi:Fe-S cluster assembly sulfur transfer protein SufU [Intestinibaculum porci]|jgi:nitrogen fixation NifU-like protein|uniref:Zinc-dependent sulfurtransferase SufU n=1 Tax=Intestinibaculum porci TaxID=2487118 RepID=A0A3G9JRY8_9FIRM|nr:SUF system NifU family Fe-S cluster assembly protein [Intestinibaculum porci]MDD6350029.1 SUF system NifU family Fe-S cluster assembly protein [Intestinibaculum porci]MDD6423628.1 SUF system NifU family Fe-S cluster assembly protein [Intestinibaculum porci]BBH27138.1 zinc-dependent sulfurtransferase SufU [Intestinibaculum porci]
MRSLDNPLILREIIMDHYENPRNHGIKDDPAYIKTNMNSETCIDNIDVEAKFNGDVIDDVRFDGEACAISTASTSIMTELVKGKTTEEARDLMKNYMNMIFEKDYDEDKLEEAIAFKNTHKQANRIKCATIGWNALEKLLEEHEKEGK